MSDHTSVPNPTGNAATDTANIQAAINSLPPTGGQLVFQIGIYLVNSTITLPTQGLVVGEAPAALPDQATTAGTVIRFVSPFTWSNGRMIDATAANNLGIFNMAFELPSGTITDPGVPNASCLAVANSTYLYNVVVRNVRTAGTNFIWGVRQIGGGTWVTADHLFIINCDGGARFDNAALVQWNVCYLGNSGNNYNLQVVQTPPNSNSIASFEQCVFDETGGIPSAFIMAGAQDVTFNNCLFYANGAPAVYDGGTRSTFNNCKLLPWGTNPNVYPYANDGGSNGLLTGCFLRSSPNQPVVFLVNNGSVTLDGCTISPGAGGSLSKGTGLATFRECSGVNPKGNLGAATPAVPPSATPVTNATGFDATVYITGGTVSAVAIGGSTTGLTSGSFSVPVGQTITLTYTAAPTWRWFGS